MRRQASRILLGEEGQTGTWDSCANVHLGFCYLMGPSLVMMKETVKVAMVARSKVLGNVLR